MTIALDSISRRFGDVAALDRVDLAIGQGEFLTLLGPSGCGKSTLLRIIAGLDRPTSGRVLMGGRDVTDLPPSQRGIAMVFQNYALYPHMTVAQNVALPLAMARMSRLERAPFLSRMLPSARAKAAANAGDVARIAQVMGLAPLLHRRPSELSGGQKQRVAVARALVRDPAAFLLDEPLSNLDAQLRVAMRAEIADLHARTGKTFVYVTHDQSEAMALSDRIAVMGEGRIAQIGQPEDIYAAPADTYVAEFVGEAPINLVAARADAHGRIAPPFAGLVVAGAPSRLTLGLRPEALRRATGGAHLRGRVARAEYLGAHSVVTVAVDGAGELRMTVPLGVPVARPGAPVGLAIDPDRALIFDARTGARLPLRAAAADGARMMAVVP